MIIASELRLPEMFSDWEMPMSLYMTSYGQKNWGWLIRKGAIEGFGQEESVSRLRRRERKRRERKRRGRDLTGNITGTETAAGNKVLMPF